MVEAGGLSLKVIPGSGGCAWDPLAFPGGLPEEQLYGVSDQSPSFGSCWLLHGNIHFKCLSQCIFFSHHHKRPAS